MEKFIKKVFDENTEPILIVGKSADLEKSYAKAYVSKVLQNAKEGATKEAFMIPRDSKPRPIKDFNLSKYYAVCGALDSIDRYVCVLDGESFQDQVSNTFGEEIVAIEVLCIFDNKEIIESVYLSDTDLITDYQRPVYLNGLDH